MFLLERRLPMNELLNLIVDELRKANESQLRIIYRYVKRFLS